MGKKKRGNKKRVQTLPFTAENLGGEIAKEAQQQAIEDHYKTGGSKPLPDSVKEMNQAAAKHAMGTDTHTGPALNLDQTDDILNTYTADLKDQLCFPCFYLVDSKAVELYVKGKIEPTGIRFTQDSKEKGERDIEQEILDTSDLAFFLISLEQDLEYLLSLEYIPYMQHMIHNQNLKKFISHFLDNCQKNRSILLAYDKVSSESKELDQIQGEIKIRMSSIMKCVLKCYYRFIQNSPRLSFEDPDNFDQSICSDHFLGKSLYNKRVLDMPKMLDMCQIYGNSNCEMLQQMFSRVFFLNTKFVDHFKESWELLLKQIKPEVRTLATAADNTDV